MTFPQDTPPARTRPTREQRRLRRQRHRRRAYIRSVYFLPSMATLGNAICGFAAMYVTTLLPETLSTNGTAGHDPIAVAFSNHRFLVAAYLIFLAMVFDALDGRLARFARHTTDFGGQLDSLADVVSFGCAPAFLALQLFKAEGPQHFPLVITRLVWGIGALYMSCAAIRLARFNVSNEHGEQHHFSFLGLPSPGAGAVVAAFVLMQQDLTLNNFPRLAYACTLILPFIVCAAGLLMVSAIRYPHFVNQYLRGRRSIARLVAATIFALLFLVAHRYVLALGTLAYTLLGPLARLRRKSTPQPLPPPVQS